MISTLSSKVAAIALVLLAAAAVPTAPASPPGPEKDLTPAERIKKALDGVADVSVENQPLEQALRQLGEQAKVNFVVDRFALQHIVGDPQGLVVNASLKGAKVRSALRAILSQHNLGYAVVGGFTRPAVPVPCGESSAGGATGRSHRRPARHGE